MANVVGTPARERRGEERRLFNQSTSKVARHASHPSLCLLGLAIDPFPWMLEVTFGGTVDGRTDGEPGFLGMARTDERPEISMAYSMFSLYVLHCLIPLWLVYTSTLYYHPPSHNHPQKVEMRIAVCFIYLDELCTPRRTPHTPTHHSRPVTYS